jgi:hypothetical protein
MKRRSDTLKYRVHHRWWVNKVIRLANPHNDSGNKVTIPCGQCTKCCENSLVDVTYEVKAGIPYRTQRHNAVPDQIILRRRANGHCVYLNKNGCSIEHSKKPAICRSFDCRDERQYNTGTTQGKVIWIIGQTLNYAVGKEDVL